MSQLEINETSYNNDGKPIDKLFKAIYVLQELPDCEEEVASLTKKLEEAWEDIKDKGGVKTWGGGYKYWPNGLCEMTRHTYVQIVLSTWDNKSKFKDKTDLNDYKDLRDMNKTWSRQLRQQTGRKFQIEERERIGAKVVYETIQKIESLSDEEKQFIDMSKLQKEKKSAGERFFKWFKQIDLERYKNGYRHDNNLSFIATLLAPSEIEEVKKILDKDNGWYVQRNLQDYFEKISKISHVKGRVEISFKGVKYNKYDEVSNGAELFDIVYPQILQITDENVKAILKKMEII